MVKRFFIGQSYRARIMREKWGDGQNATFKYKEILAKHVKPGMRILQAGCGWDKNNVTRPYKEICDVVGIDLDPRVEAKYHSKFILGSISKMPIENESFDIITSEYVMEHIEEPAAAFREMARVLRPGGWLFLLTPNLYSYKGLIAHLTPYKFHIKMGRLRDGKGYEADVYPTFYRCNTASNLSKMALANGFCKINIRFITNGPTWFEKLPILFEVFHLFHLVIARWEGARQLRCALILEAQKKNSEQRRSGLNLGYF